MAALQSDSTPQHYANQQGIKIKALYDWKHRLIQMEVLNKKSVQDFRRKIPTLEK